MNSQTSSRREFIARSALAGIAASVSLPALAADAASKKYKLITFTKPFRTLNAKETADLVAEVGWDGVELPVRAKDGQFTPAQADELLPKFVEALRANGGREVSIVTTDITEANASAEKLLRLAQKLGIKRYRLGFFRYATNKSVAQQLAEIAPKLRDLAALNKELGLRAGFQNHSGNGYVGAPVWDVWTMIRDLDPKHIGYCFDIGHATIEGGLSWPTNFRLASSHLTAVFVKDFYWKKTDKGWKDEWCPLGEGTINPKFFSALKATDFDGPICQHNEYDMHGEEMSFYKKDFATLKRWIAAA
jgi:sugar phosphate isomerase/epimerase